jgi:hypothetical protein
MYRTLFSVKKYLDPCVLIRTGNIGLSLFIHLFYFSLMRIYVRYFCFSGRSLMASKDNKLVLPSQTFLCAAQWEEKEGNTLSALALYVKAERLDQFAQLFLGNARHWFASSHRDKIGDVLSLITDSEKDQYLWCWVWQSLLVLPFEPDKSRQLAKHAFQLFKTENDI